LYLIDRVGRKTLLLIGSFGYIISLAAVAWCFYSHASASLLVFFLAMFIASHAVGTRRSDMGIYFRNFSEQNTRHGSIFWSRDTLGLRGIYYTRFPGFL
jgi:MFS family permease